MGLLRIKLWLKPKPKPDWQETLRERAALLSQLNHNLSNLAWQTCSPSKPEGMCSRLVSAACSALQSAKSWLSSNLPPPLKAFCCRLHRLSHRPRLWLSSPLRRLWLSLTTLCLRLCRKLLFHLCLLLMRRLAPQVVSWLLRQFVTPFLTAVNFGLAGKPKRLGPTPTLKPNMSQLWLCSLVTASWWLMAASRLSGFFAVGSTARRTSSKKP